MPDLVLPPVSDADRGRVWVQFIGNATTLVRWGGFTLLTDPNFIRRGEKVALGYGLRSTRTLDPALRLDELPPLDAVVLSHLHGDHFDQVALRELDRGLPIVTTPHGARGLSRRGFTATSPLQTWQSQTLRRGDAFVRVTAVPGTHAPGPLALLLPSVMGSVWELGEGDDVRLRLYVTGDTLLHDDLAEIPRRFPGLDLALVHLGGTKVAGILLTMDADQGIAALRMVRPRRAIPIHTDDYTVFTSSLADFRRAADFARLDTELTYLERGETHELPIG